MSVLQHFEEYQKARVKFVQAVAEAATRPQNIEVMNNAGVMQLLRPLLLDNVSSLELRRFLCVSDLCAVLSFRFRAFSKRLRWRWVDSRTIVKTWQKLSLEMRYCRNWSTLYRIKM
jgi:hypothetical protein